MSSNVTSVTCNHCGAPLEAPSGARYVTCAHCGSRLEIHRTDSSVYTEVLEVLDQRTREMAEDLDAIRRQNELEQLDREWSMRREGFLVHSKNGGTNVPSVAGGVIGCIVAVVFGIFWISITASTGAPGFFPLFGVLFIVVGLFAGISSMTKASGYQQAEQEYQQRRAELMRPHSSPPRETES
jgi:LSD1 subclass zinc finger protein